MKPMLLARENPDITKLKYPLYVLPKLDGIRCLSTNAGLVTRTLKPIPNKFINETLGYLPEGFDGELIVGSPTAGDVYRRTNSGVMSIDGEPDFTYYVFDLWKSECHYGERQYYLQKEVKALKGNLVVYLMPRQVDNATQLMEFEKECIDDGYEGIIIRDPSAKYKFGRTTLKEHNAFKLKRFTDSEAVVIAIIPEMHNANEAKTNELGRTQRSTAKSGLVPKESMGALLVYDPSLDVTFQIGTGFSAEDRLWWYANGKRVIESKQEIVYKFFPVGVKEKPRHPVFKGFRDSKDK